MLVRPQEASTLYARWLLELWEGEYHVVGEIVSPDFVAAIAGDGGGLRGRDELVAAIRQCRSNFDDLRFEIDLGPIVEGELVAARWTAHDIASGYALSGHDILRVENGQIAEYWGISGAPAPAGLGGPATGPTT